MATEDDVNQNKPYLTKKAQNLKMKSLKMQTAEMTIRPNISPNTPIYIKCLSLNPMSSSIFIFSPFNFSIRSCNCQRIKLDWLESSLNYLLSHLNPNTCKMKL